MGVRMSVRLERKLQLLAVIAAAGIISGIAFNLPQGRSILVGVAYGLLISLILGGIELFVLEGPMRVWLSGLSFTLTLIVRSVIYATIISVIQWFELGAIIARVPLDMSSKIFWYSFIYSAVISVLFNLVL